MKFYQLRSIDNRNILYEGTFANFAACLEQAVQDRVALDCVNLRNKNLMNANLDDAIMPNADFQNCNLSGANMSEAYFKGASFCGTTLYNTCFFDSNLTACNFDSASFGATDVHGSILNNSQFSTLSCFNLDFTNTRNMDGCIFINPDGRICQMSKPPVVIRGMGKQIIVLLDNHAKIGHNVIDQKRLKPLAEKLSIRALKKHLAA